MKTYGAVAGRAIIALFVSTACGSSTPPRSADPGLARPLSLPNAGIAPQGTEPFKAPSAVPQAHACSNRPSPAELQLPSACRRAGPLYVLALGPSVHIDRVVSAFAQQ